MGNGTGAWCGAWSAAAALLMRRIASCRRRTASTLRPSSSCWRAVSWYAFACVKAAAARALTWPWHSGASSITADQ